MTADAMAMIATAQRMHDAWEAHCRALRAEIRVATPGLDRRSLYAELAAITEHLPRGVRDHALRVPRRGRG